VPCQQGTTSAKGRGRAHAAPLDMVIILSVEASASAGPAHAVPFAPTANSLAVSTSAMPTRFAVPYGARQVHLHE